MTAAGSDVDDDPMVHSGRFETSTSDGLDHFADTVDRAGFTLALDSLIIGLESVYLGVQVGRESAGYAAS